MTALWGLYLELFQSALFGLTQFYGGQLGSAIVSLSISARLLLLPWSIRLTLRARAHARLLRSIRPELKAVREKWSADPKRMVAETQAVYARNHLTPLDVGPLKGALLQTPVFVGLFHTVRKALGAVGRPQSFLWVSHLARPDIGIALLATAIVGLGAVAGTSEGQPRWALAVPALSAGVMALMLSAGFGLYLMSSGLVGVLQGLIVRRIEMGSGRDAL